MSHGKQDWVQYCNRENWSDVTPLPQDDGPHSVVRIAYPGDLIDVYDYLRAIIASGELSERALALTEDAISFNAANYSVWQYRRKIIEHLKCDLEAELEFSLKMIVDHPKNYQNWHHRRVIVGWHKDGSEEKRLTEIIFESDPKNYHAWEHRQWVLKTFNNYEGELEFVDELLGLDVQNNSAWNQRYFVISQTTGFTPEVIAREIEYTKAAIEKMVDNESPWTYLAAVIQQSTTSLSKFIEIEDWCHTLYKDSKSTHLIAFMIEIIEDHLESNDEGKEKYLESALTMCSDLATKHDRIRKNYWDFVSKRLKNKWCKLQNGNCDNLCENKNELRTN